MWPQETESKSKAYLSDDKGRFNRQKKSSYFRVGIESNQNLHVKTADTSKVSCALNRLCSKRVLGVYIVDTVPMACMAFDVR